MASSELGASTDTNNFGFSTLPLGDTTNYNSDSLPDSTVSSDGTDGLTNSLDNIFKYAKDTVDLGKSVGVIPVGNQGQATQASQNPNGTVQPTGANPVIQNKQTTTAVSWIQAHPVMTGAIALGSVGAIFLIVKLLK